MDKREMERFGKLLIKMSKKQPNKLQRLYDDSVIGLAKGNELGFALKQMQFWNTVALTKTRKKTRL